MAGASMSGPKIIAFEGEFAIDRGPRPELKTQALALQVGKRLRVMFSDKNAASTTRCLGGVIASNYDHYNLLTVPSYGWNVSRWMTATTTNQVVAALKTMDDWDPKDRRPMIVIGENRQGLWPCVSHGKIAGTVRSS